VQVPGEVGSPFGAVVRLNSADGRRKGAPNLVDEVDGGLNRIVVVDLEDAIAGRFIDRVNW
jgi:hypothetical protein